MEEQNKQNLSVDEEKEKAPIDPSKFTWFPKEEEPENDPAEK